MVLPSAVRLHGFLPISAALIGAAVLVSGFVVGGFIQRHLLAHEEERTASAVQAQAARHLALADFEPPAPGVDRSAFTALLQEFPDVFRIKVFDRASRIIWSNEPRLVGRAFPDNPFLGEALRGRGVTASEPPTGAEHEYERGRAHVAEAYVPIRLPGSPGVVGVIETYKDTSGAVLKIRHTQRLIWGVAAGIGLLLYVALGLVAWRASLSELRAIGCLEAQNRDLVRLHESNVELFTTTRQAHERLAAILAAIADRMVIVDREMRLVWVNAAAAETLGADGTILGRVCFQVLGAEPEACLECPAVRTFRSGKVERGLRAARLPGGGVRYLDLVTAPLRDASGQVYQVLEVSRDITELVEVEDRLKRSAEGLERSHAALLAKTEELERANRALRETREQLVDHERLAAVGQVVVGLHHAILNPLAGVLGALQVLREERLAPPARAEAFAQAEAEIRKIERLIRRLATLPRATSTPYVGDTTMLDLEPPGPGGERA